MGWLIFLALAALAFVGLWRAARPDRSALQLIAAGLFLALAGYAWQGHPSLAGKPLPPPKTEERTDSDFAQTRERMLGRFDIAAVWLTLAESYQRGGDTRNGVDVIRAGLKSHPRDADLWVGLGNALVLHADGLMTPAAELAFRRAEQIAPGHPGPRFFYGLALAQGGRFDEAEAIWRQVLASAPPDASWRPMIEERVAAIAAARAAGAIPPAP